MSTCFKNRSLFALRSFNSFGKKDPLMNHQEKVQRIVEQLKNHAPTKGPLSLQKDAVSHVVPNPHDPKHRDQKVNLRGLNEILRIDLQEKICEAEPGVTFFDLVQKTIPLNLVPLLVPELKTITIGGAVSGCSVESMSYKYGGFHDSCLEYEIITGTGEVLTCSSDQNADLFHMIHGSYGTLGIISKLKFKLIAAKPFVKIEYLRYRTFDQFATTLRQQIQLGQADFLDGIIHAPDNYTLCLGEFVNQAPYTSDYTWLHIYYKSTREKSHDYLTTTNYLFRYDTECHWLSRSIPGMETKLLRLLLGKQILSSTNLLGWSKRLAPLLRFDKRPDVVVDVFIPWNRFEKFYRRYQAEINYYPLWIVPYRRVQKYPWINEEYDKRIGDPLFIDLAVYGLKNRRRDLNYYQILEEMVYDCNGIKTLISHNSYSKERFWEIYNRPNYEKIKQRTDPQNRFRELYEKFHFEQ